MTWLDHVLATPIVGCAFKPSFQTAQDYLSALRPLLKRWGETADLSITAEKPMSLTIENKNGFSYSIEPDKFVVQFRYRYELKQKPGDIVPQLSGLEVKKYSSLLENTIDEYCEAFDQIAVAESRTLGRLGIVANCRLDGEALPPGVALFLKYLGRPWGGSLAKCQAHLLGTISESDKIKDRCHYQIDVNDDRKNDVRLTLDWQRLFLSEPQVSRGKLLREHFKKCSGDAMAYFELFGKGDLKYGDLD